MSLHSWTTLEIRPEALTLQALPYLAVIALAALLTIPKPWRGLQPIDGWIMLAAYVIYVAPVNYAQSSEKRDCHALRVWISGFLSGSACRVLHRRLLLAGRLPSALATAVFTILLISQQVGLAYGTLGSFSLTVGGVLGGWLVFCYGVKRSLVPMPWPAIYRTYFTST